MNKLLILILAFLCFPLFAQQYTVLYLSADDIYCGGTKVSVKDTISDNSTIDWGSANSPYMIVKNLITKQQRKLTGPKMKQEGVTSIVSFYSWLESFRNYYIKTNNTSTQSIPAKLLKIDLVSDTFYLDDVITIETNLPVDGEIRFFSLCSQTQKNKRCKLCMKDDFLILISKKELLDGGLIRKTQKEARLFLEYSSPSSNKPLRKELTFIIVE